MKVIVLSFFLLLNPYPIVSQTVFFILFAFPFCLGFRNRYTPWPGFFTGTSSIYAGSGKFYTLCFIAVCTIRPQSYTVSPLIN